MTVWRQPIPKETRRVVLKRANGCCENCGREYSARQLELHHLRYYTAEDMIGGDLIGGEDLRGKEEPDDLMALCRECHHARHIDPAGQFWTDPEAMEEEWFMYHWSMDKAD